MFAINYLKAMLKKKLEKKDSKKLYVFTYTAFSLQVGDWTRRTASVVAYDLPSAILKVQSYYITTKMTYPMLVEEISIDDKDCVIFS